MMHPMVRKSLLLFGTIVLLTPHIVAAAFAVGDRVQATADLAVRSAATTSSPILRTIESPTLGTIIGGPTTNTNTWWNIKWDSSPKWESISGWSVQKYLRKIPQTFTPLQGNNVFLAPADSSYEYSNGNVNPAAVTQSFFRQHADIYDFVAIFTDYPGTGTDFNVRVKNTIAGLGPNTLEDSSALFGSAGFLKAVTLNHIHVPLSGAYTFTDLPHEILHYWLAFIPNTPAIPLNRGAHWSHTFDTTTNFGTCYYYDGNGGDAFVDNGYGTFSPTSKKRCSWAFGGAANMANSLDLYLMGLVPASAVQPLTLWIPEDPTADLSGAVRGTKKTVAVQDIISIAGKRAPAYPNTQRNFKMAWIYVPKGAPDPWQIENIKWAAKNFPKAWNEVVTRGRSTIDGVVVSPNPSTATDTVIQSFPQPPVVFAPENVIQLPLLGFTIRAGTSGYILRSVSVQNIGTASDAAFKRIRLVVVNSNGSKKQLAQGVISNRQVIFNSPVGYISLAAGQSRTFEVQADMAADLAANESKSAQLSITAMADALSGYLPIKGNLFTVNASIDVCSNPAAWGYTCSTPPPPTATLTASPNPCTLIGTSTKCSSTLSWNTGTTTKAQLWVTIDGKASTTKKWACGNQTGTYTAPWIVPKHTYVFNLYATPLCTTAITGLSPNATVTVTGKPASSAFNVGSSQVAAGANGVAEIFLRLFQATFGGGSR